MIEQTFYRSLIHLNLWIVLDFWFFEICDYCITETKRYAYDMYEVIA